MNGPCFQESDFKANRIWRCFHSGDLGDIIYSLLFCRSLGNVELFIGPEHGVRVREPMTPQKFHWLAPLLRRQSWIKSVEFSNGLTACDYNLNDFRKSWFHAKNAHRKDKRLFECYSEHFGHPPLPENEAWLTAEPAVDTAHPVVINRTGRWRNEAFPWRDVSKAYAGRMVFVGVKAEYDDWIRRYGHTAEYRPILDALDLANVISGSQLFIGNQSLPMALALALNVPVIQESCPIQADCVFHRDNSQFTQHSPKISLPPLANKVMKPVVTYATRNGLIELGPFNGAPGIGDTLMITPLARALGKKCVMLLPRSMERLAFLFRNICPVVIQDNHPVFTFQSGVLQSTGILRMFRLAGVDPLPSIEINPDDLEQAKKHLEGIPNPLAFCPTCSRHWSIMRQRPALFWRPIIKELSNRYTVLQFGLPDYPAVEGAKRMPFVPLPILAALYKLIGRYVGVNTGDHHLMMAVGGRLVVAEADPWPEAACWTYHAPGRIEYGKLSHSGTVLDAIKRLGL